MNGTETAPNPQPAPTAPAVGPDPRRRSPFLAGVLSVLPGLGQVYLGYYRRGLVQFVIAVSILTLAVNEVGGDRILPLFALGMMFAWTFCVVDAVRRASLYNLALAGIEPMALPQDFEWPDMPGSAGSFLWGAILVVGGILLLLHTRFGVPLDWVAEWWPAALVLVGAYLFARAWTDRPKAPGESIDPGPTTE